MTQTTVATKVHQTLDAQGDFTTQITFNDKSANCFTQLLDLFFRQLTDLNIFSDPRRGTDSLGTGLADTENSS
ncbi:hypothetical protein HMPREF0880_00745 [Yokenella regensburgei ATCC 43003]|nr:hypothetical protein HMPREF0880_00745 [Yokenella regensburgei ATCC 43003]